MSRAYLSVMNAKGFYTRLSSVLVSGGPALRISPDDAAYTPIDWVVPAEQHYTRSQRLSADFRARMRASSSGFDINAVVDQGLQKLDQWKKENPPEPVEIVRHGSISFADYFGYHRAEQSATGENQ